MKFETGQTLFFSDVLTPLSSTGSRDEKVTLPDTTMATPANENVIRLLKGTYKSKFFFINLVSWNIFIDALGLSWLLWKPFTYCCRQGFIVQ